MWKCNFDGFPVPNSKVHGANMAPIWGRQDSGGPHVGPINFVIWGVLQSQTWYRSVVTIDPSHGYKNALAKYPTMHHVITGVCTYAHFCDKMVHSGIWDWRIVRLVQQVYSHVLQTNYGRRLLNITCKYSAWVSSGCFVPLSYHWYILPFLIVLRT